MLLSVFLPLSTFLVIALFGRFLGKAGSTYFVSISCLWVVIYNFKLFVCLLELSFRWTIQLGV